MRVEQKNCTSVTCRLNENKKVDGNQIQYLGVELLCEKFMFYGVILAFYYLCFLLDLFKILVYIYINTYIRIM